MRVVIDTNVLLASLPRRGRYRPILNNLISGKHRLLVSTEVLAEYAEIVEQQTTSEISDNVLGLINSLPLTEHIVPSNRWRLVIADPDDNKFTDLAIAGRADVLVTNDKHFNVLATVPFPKVNICSGLQFLDYCD